MLERKELKTLEVGTTFKFIGEDDVYVVVDVAGLNGSCKIKKLNGVGVQTVRSEVVEVLN